MGSTDDLLAWELLVRFHRRATRAMDAELRERHGLSLDDYDLLHQLRQADRPLRMTDLAERLLVANSSCNRLVARLAQRGLVDRRPGPSDRRQVLVALTAEGRRIHRRMAVTHRRDIERLMVGRMSPEERATVAAILGRLLEEGTPPSP
jgi:DNA-binding MarR family transcriptional regulator